eukprot:1334879-Amphidinium_carterae.1
MVLKYFVGHWFALVCSCCYSACLCEQKSKGQFCFLDECHSGCVGLILCARCVRNCYADAPVLWQFAARELIRRTSPESAVYWWGGRIKAARLHAIVRGGLVCISFYGTAGATAEEQLQQLAALVRYIRTIMGPWVLGGDWQMSPQQLSAWGFPQALGASIHYPPHPTCSTGNTIDYFLVPHEMDALIMATTLIECPATSPHTLVMLHLRGITWEDAVWVQRMKRKFPEVQPMGPHRFVPPPTWHATQLAEMWGEWSDAAEHWLMQTLELEGATSAWKGRSKGLQLRRVSLAKYLETRHPPRCSIRALAWRRLHHVVRKLLGLDNERRGNMARWAYRAAHAELQPRLEPLMILGRHWSLSELISKVLWGDRMQSSCILEAIAVREAAEWKAAGLEASQRWQTWAKEVVQKNGYAVHRWLKRQPDDSADIE